jgi:uncharacterized protein (DUF1778 family)
MRSTTKSERLALRLAASDKAKLASAAAIQHRSVTEFVLAASREAAEHVLGERTRFHLPPARHRAFLAALDAPARELAELKRLFSRRSVLER